MTINLEFTVNAEREMHPEFTVKMNKRELHLMQFGLGTYQGRLVGFLETGLMGGGMPVTPEAAEGIRLLLAELKTLQSQLRDSSPTNYDAL
jgi:hypothetical protein